VGISLFSDFETATGLLWLPLSWHQEQFQKYGGEFSSSNMLSKTDPASKHAQQQGHQD